MISNNCSVFNFTLFGPVIALNIYVFTAVKFIVEALEQDIEYHAVTRESGDAGRIYVMRGIEKWKSISEYAKKRNINISPLVQGLGHASYILKHEQNKKLRDDPKSDWAFNPLDPETYQLQFDLYLDAMEATPYGKYLHVGGDEVQTTGRKSGKSALELNLIWLNKVSAFAEKHNRIPVFWDDMLLKQGEVYYPIYDLNISVQKVDSIWEVNEPKLNKFIKQFPENCIYMRWNYHATESYGNSRAMDWFTNNGLKVMGATAGQTRWTLMPQRESNIDQIRIFADQSIKRNFNGLLLTLWDDDSPHFELYKRGISLRVYD